MKKLALLITLPLIAMTATLATTTAAASGARAASGTLVSTAHTKLGTVLVGPNGHTLYLFTADKGTKSACTSAACISFWPWLKSSGSPRAGGSAKAHDLGVSAAKQVTYDGHPLYYFKDDSAAGQTNGQGVSTFGGTWWAVSPSGSAVK